MTDFVLGKFELAVITALGLILLCALLIVSPYPENRNLVPNIIGAIVSILSFAFLYASIPNTTDKPKP